MSPKNIMKPLNVASPEDFKKGIVIPMDCGDWCPEDTSVQCDDPGWETACDCTYDADSVGCNPACSDNSYNSPPSCHVECTDFVDIPRDPCRYEDV